MDDVTNDHVIKWRHKTTNIPGGLLLVGDVRVYCNPGVEARKDEDKEETNESDNFSVASFCRFTRTPEGQCYKHFFLKLWLFFFTYGKNATEKILP